SVKGFRCGGRHTNTAQHSLASRPPVRPRPSLDLARTGSACAVRVRLTAQHFFVRPASSPPRLSLSHYAFWGRAYTAALAACRSELSFRIVVFFLFSYLRRGLGQSLFRCFSLQWMEQHQRWPCRRSVGSVGPFSFFFFFSSSPAYPPCAVPAPVPYTVHISTPTYIRPHPVLPGSAVCCGLRVAVTRMGMGMDQRRKEGPQSW
ncbi:hypothetical protein MAPG_00444, partial [Magnaporthiopsis poae ATCC 64411]